MQNGTYAISADTPLGRKSGTLTYTREGTRISATAKAAGISCSPATGTFDGTNLELSGAVSVLFVKVAYRVTGTVTNGQVDALCTTDKGSSAVHGTVDDTSFTLHGSLGAECIGVTGTLR